MIELEHDWKRHETQEKGGIGIVNMEEESRRTY